MAFKKGNKFAKGGDHGGSGRPPDWLKAKCQKIVEKAKLIEWLGDVAEGKDVDIRTEFDAKKGEYKKVKCPASIKDRKSAVDTLLERGWGKAAQLVGEDPNNRFENPVILLPPQDLGECGKVDID